MSVTLFEQVTFPETLEVKVVGDDVRIYLCLKSGSNEFQLKITGKHAKALFGWMTSQGEPG